MFGQTNTGAGTGWNFNWLKQPIKDPFKTNINSDDVFNLDNSLTIPEKPMTDLVSEIPLTKTDQVKGWLKNKFDDPNFIQALSQIGIGLDPTGVGGALGKASLAWSQSKADQKAVAKQATGQKDLTHQIMSKLKDGSLLSDPQDNKAFDGIDISGNGDMKLRYKNTPQTNKFSFAEGDEGIAKLNNINVNELPSAAETIGYQGLTAEDLRGVSPDMLKLIMTAENQNNMDIRDKIYNKGLEDLKYDRTKSDKEKANEVAILQKAKDRAALQEAEKLKREQDVSDTGTEQNFKKEMEKIKHGYKIAQIMERAKQGESLSIADKATIDNYNLNVKKFEQATNIANKRDARAEESLKDKQNEKWLRREETTRDFLADSDKSHAQKQQEARTMNNENKGAEVYYYDRRGFNKWNSLNLKEMSINGKPVTKQMILKDARTAVKQGLVDSINEYFQHVAEGNKQ